MEDSVGKLVANLDLLKLASILTSSGSPSEVQSIFLHKNMIGIMAEDSFIHLDRITFMKYFLIASEEYNNKKED